MQLVKYPRVLSTKTPNKVCNIEHMITFFLVNNFSYSFNSKGTMFTPKLYNFFLILFLLILSSFTDFYFKVI